ncbi:MAG TPA: SDR family oxidoreductase [Candidatus Limnocylindria bacterium]|nr:SDR family oxidoreductase [Candidatus Limnocylindria bacterium]
MSDLPAYDPERLFPFAVPRDVPAAPQPAPAAPAAAAATHRFLHPQGGMVPGERVLITGIAGSLGRLLTHRLRGRYGVLGVDRNGWPGHPADVQLHLIDLRKRRFEDIIRTERPDTIVHYAFVRHFRGDPEIRHEVNVLGTRRLLEYAAEYGVKRIVVLSSGYVYGALPDNPTFLDEEASLNVSRTYPAIRDLAEVDHLVLTFLWKHPEIATTLLRPVSMLGPNSHTAISRFLRARLVPMIVGFDPMMQFIHEEDVADAVVLAMEKGTRGVFNVVGPGAVPLSVAIRECGGTAVPLLEPVARVLFAQLFQLGLYHTPADAIDFLKYSCTLDGRRFVATTGFTPRHSLRSVFASIRRR